ncbi:uncharacterized protein LTHEOB_4657 [Lasiodiplodia theobromae]|uniref:uncharacterized protein n=1 Tax=Lasiodiplodia theobromae TaxID=45133 RepID=UPI0015C31FAB|nr:uncharacterized protein LTHEOB_4657 [Lasiodiplodia theobromae]KAF4546005.1 hypothetical protein LTHEOB_4657 [Lasiodiplodia theobromae]
MTDNWGPEDLSELRRTICRQVRIKDAGQTATSMTLAHRPAPTSSHLHPTAAAGGKRSPTTDDDEDARLASLVTETAVAYFPEGRDAFIACGGKTCCDDDLIDDIIDARRRVRRQQQQRADESKGQQAGENIEHYTGHADDRGGKEGHNNNEQDASRADGDDDYDYVLDLRHPVVASWEDSREKEDGEGDGSIIDSAFGGELDDEDEDEDWEQVDDADEANDADDEDEMDSDSDTDTDTTDEGDMPGGAYTLAAALALPYEVVDDDDDSEEDEETTGAKYVLAPEYAARFKIVEVDEETEEVDWEDQSDLLAEWGSYSDYYDEYGEGERVKKKARVV